MGSYAENYDQIIYSKLVKLENEIKDETLIPSEFNMSPLVHLWNLLYSTITNAEIQVRGSPLVRHSAVEQNHVCIGILDQVSESTLKLLRVLSETGLTALYLSAQKFSDCLQQYSIDFLKSFLPDSSRKTGPRMHTPLLLRDGFKHLVYLFMGTFTQIPNSSSNQALMWVRLMGFFEIVRGVVSFVEGKLNYQNAAIPRSNEFALNPKQFQWFCKLFWLIKVSLGTSMEISPEQIPFMFHYVKSNYLLYLRKCVILMYTRFGLVPPSGSLGFGDPKRGSYSQIDELEIDRLCKYLNLPVFEVFLQSVEDPFYTAMISHWCENLKDQDAAHWGRLGSSPDIVPKITIDQPQMFELIELPKRLEVLLEVAFHTQCKKYRTGICI
jgi:hypothetical protein